MLSSLQLEAAAGEREQRLPHSDPRRSAGARRQAVAIRAQPRVELSLGRLGHCRRRCCDRARTPRRSPARRSTRCGRRARRAAPRSGRARGAHSGAPTSRDRRRRASRSARAIRRRGAPGSTKQRRDVPCGLSLQRHAPPATARRATSVRTGEPAARARPVRRPPAAARRATEPRSPRASRSARRTPSSTSSILRCSSIHTGRMLQLCDDEHRSSPTGCDTQWRSNVVVSDASITSRIEISIRRPGQRVTAVRAARAADEAGATQPEQNLLDVVAAAAARRSAISRPVIGPSATRDAPDGARR